MLRIALKAVSEPRPSPRPSPPRDVLLVVLCHFNGPVDEGQHVRGDQIPLSGYSDARAVSIQQLAMLDELGQLRLGQCHQTLDLASGPVEVLDTKGVDRDDLDAGLVADFENLQDANVISGRDGVLDVEWAIRAQGPRSPSGGPRWPRSCGSWRSVGCRPSRRRRAGARDPGATHRSGRPDRFGWPIAPGASSRASSSRWRGTDPTWRRGQVAGTRGSGYLARTRNESLSLTEQEEGGGDREDGLDMARHGQRVEA